MTRFAGSLPLEVPFQKISAHRIEQRTGQSAATHRAQAAANFPEAALILAARGESRTEPFGVGSGRMQGAAKRRILEVFKRAATQQPAQHPPERRRGDFRHGLLGLGTGGYGAARRWLA